MKNEGKNLDLQTSRKLKFCFRSPPNTALNPSTIVVFGGKVERTQENRKTLKILTFCL